MYRLFGEAMNDKRQVRLTYEGLLYLLVLSAVLVGATARQLNLLMLLGAMLAGPFLFSLIYGRLALRRLAVKRVVPDHLRSEQRLSVEVQLSNRRRWLRLWSIRVDDFLAREAPAGDREPANKVSVFIPTIGRRESSRATYQGTLDARGRYRFGPMRISTRFPLGLVRHTVVLGDPDTLLVHPRLGRLTRELGQVLRESAAGSQRLRRGLLEADFYGLRDWRTGDSRRWIHWRTSARRGTLVVREFEQRRNQDLAILVDLWQPVEARPQQRRAVETAIRFAATLIAEACSQPGRQVVLHLAAATAMDRAGAATAVFFREQMDALAVIEPHSLDEVPDSLVRALAMVGPGVPTIVIGTRPADVEALDSAAARNDVVLSGRKMRLIDVTSHDLARFYEDCQAGPLVGTK
jgi:uncharacterized protein (DUF58 family)